MMKKNDLIDLINSDLIIILSQEESEMIRGGGIFSRILRIFRRPKPKVKVPVRDRPVRIENPNKMLKTARIQGLAEKDPRVIRGTTKAQMKEII